MRQSLRAAIAILFFAAIGYYWANSNANQNWLFINGNILTMTAPASAEALWVNDGRIAAVGTAENVLAAMEAASASAEVYDLQGQTLLPGLIEPHTHPLATALLDQAVNIAGYNVANREEIMHTLRHAAGEWSPNGWVIAFGWDPAIVEPLAAPTLEELDAISPEKPMVILGQMMHDAYLNSAAIEAVGLNDTVPTFDAAHFELDEQGKPTGVVFEVAAIKYVFDAIPQPPAGSQTLLLNRQYAEYAKQGYTTVATLGAVGRAPDPIGAMYELAQAESVAVRNIVYGLPEQIDPSPNKPEGWQANEGYAETAGRFKIQGVKFWIDGSPWVGGAAWDQPYENSHFTQQILHLPENHQAPLFHSQAALNSLYQKYHIAGFQIAAHTQGERAMRQVLTAHQAAQNTQLRSDARHRTEHNALISPSLLQQMTDRGLTSSYFIDHIRYYGHRVPQIVGEERAQRYMPLRSALKAGQKISLHADSPGTPPDAGRLVLSATTREALYGEAVGKQEAINRQQALKAITIDAAWQLGMDSEIGSLETGKAADLVVIKTNPLLPTTEQFDVSATWLEGRQVDTSFWTWTNIRLTLVTVWNWATG